MTLPVPTLSQSIGTGHPIDLNDCPDHPDRPDQFGKSMGGKRKSLSSLVQALRQKREQYSTPETRRVLTPLSERSVSSPHASLKVGTVGAVGTLNELRGFDAPERSGQGSGQVGTDPHGPPDEPPPISDQEWASIEALANPAELAEAVTPAPGAEDWLDEEVDSSTVEWHQQSISQDEMIRGLRAAARIRLVAPPLNGEKKFDASQSAFWTAGIAHLQTMTPLGGFTLSQWKRVQRGSAALLASHGTEMRRLGWSTEDAFGIHPRVPAAGVHCYGLGLVLGDGQVVEMTERGARILLRSGVTQSFTRLPSPWAVPIWTVGDCNHG